MKIPNPWPAQQHIRFNVNNGECTGSCGGGPEIEVPDTAVEVLIEPCARGRYDSQTLAPGRVWSKEFGMLDVEDHLKKVEIKEEGEALKVRAGAADRLRKQKEAEWKAAEEKKAKDAEAKRLRKQDGTDQRPLKEKQDEPKPEEKIDVVRAPSGLAKVTKAPEPKK